MINIIMSSASLRTGESWTPVCLSQYNNKALSSRLQLQSSCATQHACYIQQSNLLPGLCLCIHLLCGRCRAELQQKQTCVCMLTQRLRRWRCLPVNSLGWRAVLCYLATSCHGTSATSGAWDSGDPLHSSLVLSDSILPGERCSETATLPAGSFC